MQEARAAGIGKRLAWPLRPIANDDQGELSRERDTSTGVLDMEKAEKDEKESNNNEILGCETADKRKCGAFSKGGFEGGGLGTESK